MSLSLSNSSHLLSCFHGSPLIFQPSNQQQRPHLYMTWITNQEPNSFDSRDFSRSSVKREVDKSSEIISTYINSNSRGCNSKELVTSLRFSSHIAHFPLSHACPAKAYIFQLPLPWAVTTWMTFAQLKERVMGATLRLNFERTRHAPSGPLFTVDQIFIWAIYAFMPEEI